MGVIDDLLREKQVIGNHDTYVAPGQIGTSELENVGMTAADITDGTVTATQIAAAARDNTKGLTGFAGTALTLVPDGTFLELTGVTPAKTVNIADASLTLAKLAVSGKRKSVQVPLNAASAGATVNSPILTVPTGKTFTIESCSICYREKPADPNGSIVGKLVNYDVSGAAADDLSANQDLEAVTNKTGSDITIITAGSVNVLEEHDYLYFSIVAADEGADGITGAGVDGCITVFYYDT